ncbi:unnamed protein product [Bathycoccus prasinos]
MPLYFGLVLLLRVWTNITNPHDSYSVRLARPDDTILDTQVLNDTSALFLQFTASDYGTYDYKLLLSKWTTTSTSNPNIPPESYWVDTVIATHTQLFPRPEPTFTTSWTKSGLTINANLSSIVGAHPDFYAYLCRTDGTTLATHQFQTGQTTTSLSFTEPDYGTFTYHLKLGTTVVSSHTETYVRPTPTYTASFSTNELTLTTSTTSITNAHNSFAITLERDDGTVLQTYTLAEGETSFTFTQTETSYVTFNYVVKLNGTQTDTYSATYSPPPTPTFDITLTNDDLVITATLTNIVNPDPYYTLMIHDATDAHLDGHTFATGDTTVVLTWTGTSYGEKTYTKLLNGASIGTETITLTDPNVSTTPSYEFEISNGNLNATFTWDGTSDNWLVPYSTGQLTVSNQTARWQSQEYVSGYGASPGQFNPGILGVANYGPYDIQQSEAHDSTYHIVFTNNIWSITHSGFTWKITLIDPNASTTTFNPPTSYTMTGPPSVGYYPGYAINYDASKQTGTKYYYGIGMTSGGVFSGYHFYWDNSNNTWNDVQGTDAQGASGTADPVSFSYSATPVVNGTINTGIGGQGADLTFTMSGIVSSSTPPPPEATIYPNSGAWSNQHYFVYRGDIVQNGTTYFHYSLDFQPGNTITGYSILYDYTNKIWIDGDDASPFYLHSSVPLVGASFTITNPAHLHGFDTNSTEYFGFPNPYYEAPPGVPIVQSIECTPQGNAVLMDGDYTTSHITYRFNSTDESITYTNGVG